MAFVLALVGLLTTFFAGVVVEGYRLRRARNERRHDERTRAAIELIDAYTAFGSHIIMDVGAAPTPAAKLAAVLAGKPLVADFNTKVHRAQLLLGDKKVSIQLDAIDGRVGRWYQDALAGDAPPDHVIDNLHDDLLDLLRSQLDL
jgi:hypothetical protein